MSTQVRESLKNLLSSIREDLSPIYLEDSNLRLGNKVLVIGTGSARQVANLIKKIKELSPSCQIHLIARPTLLEQTTSSLEKSDHAYSYDCDGFFNIEGVRCEIDKGITDSLDSIIGVFNNVWGAGYENVYAILRDFNLKKSYTFNVEESFSEVNPSIIHSRIESLTLNKTLSDWYWENGLKLHNEN